LIGVIMLICAFCMQHKMLWIFRADHLDLI
jgi:hypothetical protein